MQLLLINSNPKSTGFCAEIESRVRERLESAGVSLDILRLRDARIDDCTACFQCLRTGACCHRDDMDAIAERMLKADGTIVIGAIRNGSVSACYKRFYERITYRLGFPLLLEDKYTLAISTVGFMGGKACARKYQGLQDVFHARLSGHLHLAVGIPSRPLSASKRFSRRLDSAVETLLRDIKTNRKRSFPATASFAMDRAIMNRFIFSSNPEVYAHVLHQWRAKGYLA